MKRLSLSVPAILGLAASQISFAEDVSHFVPPRDRTIKVAFILSEGATLIDFAGPWDVFETVHLGDDRKVEPARPFELFTVAPVKGPIHSSGANHAGMTIIPDYDFSDAPAPDIVVVAAQSGGPGFSDWLQKVHAHNGMIMSVCTGAFKLAKAGLLDGKSATTHHWYMEKFTTQYPKLSLVKEVRYVQADPIVYTAGGETSGMDLALHIVAEYFGPKEAQITADRMEYQGEGWKTNKGVAVGTAPIWHEHWQGDIDSGRTLTMHIAMQGPRLTVTIDSPWQHLTNVPATLVDDGNLGVTVTFNGTGENAAKFVAMDNQSDDTLTGTFTQDGKSYPLTMTRSKIAAR